MSGSVPTSNKNVSPIRCSEKPWDLWVTEIGHASPLRDDEPAVAARGFSEAAKGRRASCGSAKRGGQHTGVNRLRRSSMCLYGQFPNTDGLNAAVCHMCGMTVKLSATHRHLVEYHSAATDPILPPPPPAPTVKLKSSHSKSKYKKETPLPTVAPAEPDLPPPAPPAASPVPVPVPSPLPVAEPAPQIEIQPTIVTVPPRIVLTQQDMSYYPKIDTSGPKCTNQSEVKVSVDDNDLPVVSIQDNTDLPLADDIIEIMNSEGIQSIEDIPEADTAAWKNLMQDIGAIQDMPLQNTTLLTDGITTHELYDSTGTPVRVTGATYTISGDDGTLQYTQPVTLPPSLTVDNQCVTSFPVQPVQCAPVKPVQLAPVKPRHKPTKSIKSKFQIREYDPNKHCGVISGESQKPCTRSLTCKAHTLSLRRLVDGRIKSFDALLAEHRAAKQASLANQASLVNQNLMVNQVNLMNQANLNSQASLMNQTSLASQVTLVSPASMASPVGIVNQVNLVTQPTLVSPVDLANQVSLVNQVNLMNQVNLVNQVNQTSMASQSPVLCNQNTTVVGLPSPMVVPASVDISAFSNLSPDRQVTEYYNTVMSTVSEVIGEGDILLDGAAPTIAPVPPPRLPEPRPGDIYWYPSSPRPLAACTFSACHMGNALLLGKRLATVRSNFKSAMMQPHSKNIPNNFYNFSQNSMSKNVHVNNSAKPSVPEVRRLILPGPCGSGSSVKIEAPFYNNRQNGHLFTSKRPLLDEYEDMDSKCLRTAGPSVANMRNKVAKHVNQSDLMELNFMFDPLMADEKC